MRAVKRVEIVVDFMELGHVTRMLEKAGISRFTIIREAIGRGDRGQRWGDGLSGEFTNSYILIACGETEAACIADLIRPVLTRFGGLCLISDASIVEP
jgi:nitrogen regulatory protein PII